VSLHGSKLTQTELYFSQQVWQARIKQLVEAWAGVKLDTTDIYGTKLVVLT
jgi:hypothetical protein